MNAYSQYILDEKNLTKTYILKKFFSFYKFYKNKGQIIKIIEGNLYESYDFFGVMNEIINNTTKLLYIEHPVLCSKAIRLIENCSEKFIYQNVPELSESYVIKPATDYIHFSTHVLDVEDKKENVIFNKKDIIDLDFCFTEEKSIFEKFVDLSFLEPDKAKLVIGYLCSNRQMRGFNKMIIIEDSIDDCNNATEGRRGKSLVINTLTKAKSLSSFYCDGKAFSSENRFSLDGLQIEQSKCLLIDDITHKFDLEFFFSSITNNSMQVEAKGKSKINLDYCPKIIVTSNRAIKIDSGSKNARVIKLVMSDYFSVDHTPVDEFGGYFIDDWDEKEMQRFYSFVITCIAKYIEAGCEINSFIANEEARHNDDMAMAGSLGQELIDWIKENVKDGYPFNHCYENYLKFVEQKNKNPYNKANFSSAVCKINNMISRRTKRETRAKSFFLRK